mmetsp:Transcript_3754/g.12600  ORF Transcript_3754/g.12600 Transcript_3754/m.12600 type:complete len:263 (-) Transcript_3754:2042-2830(-)
MIRTLIVALSFQHLAYSYSLPSSTSRSAPRLASRRPSVSVAFGSVSQNPRSTEYMKPRESGVFRTRPDSHLISKQLPHAPSCKFGSKSATAATAFAKNGKFAFDSRPAPLFTYPHAFPYRSPKICWLNFCFHAFGASKYVARPFIHSPLVYAASTPIIQDATPTTTPPTSRATMMIRARVTNVVVTCESTYDVTPILRIPRRTKCGRAPRNTRLNVLKTHRLVRCRCHKLNNSASSPASRRRSCGDCRKEIQLHCSGSTVRR